MPKNKKELGSNIRHKTSLSLEGTPIVHSKAFDAKANLSFVYKSKEYDEEKTFRFIGTSESKDRDDEIVLMSGWDFSNYKNNPVVLWGHESRTLPVGKVTAILADEVNKCIYFDVEFSESYDFAKTVKGLVEEGILRATSLGFRVTDWEWDDKADALVLTKSELFELSIVNIPANQDALLQASKDLEEAKTKDANEELFNVVSQLKDQIEALQNQLNAPTPSSESNLEGDGTGEPKPEGGEIPKTDENNNIETPVEDTKTNVVLDEASVAQIVEAVLAKLNPKEPEEEPKEGEPNGSQDEVNEEPKGVEESDLPPEEPKLTIVSIDELSETDSFVIVTEEEN